MTQPRKFKRIFHSVFTKLLIIAVLTSFGISILIVGFFVAYRHLAGEMFEGNMAVYARYLIDDIGMPPSVERAREIAEETGLAIRYEGSDDSWSTVGDFQWTDVSRLHTWHEGQGFRAGMYRGRYVMIVDRGEGRFIFEGTTRVSDERRVKRLAVKFFVLLALLLTLAFFGIRRILKPIKWLHEGVKQVGAGRLDHRVPVKNADELRDLSESFNTMTERVQDLLLSKERLLLDVSHELRSPITRMKVALEFMDEGKVKESILEDVRELERMVSDILDTYRRFKESEGLNLETVDLAGLIHDVVALFEDQPPGVDAGSVSGQLKLKVDPVKIKTVLKNIFSNAVKYSEIDAKPVTVTLTSGISMAVVEVEDHGIGIPKEALPYVFEPFYRVDTSRSRKTGGYGLGLSLSKAIVEAHGGTIEIQSELGRGTKVTLSFPIQHD